MAYWPAMCENDDINDENDGNVSSDKWWNDIIRDDDGNQSMIVFVMMTNNNNDDNEYEMAYEMCRVSAWQILIIRNDNG